jgi:hypothetical protein
MGKECSSNAISLNCVEFSRDGRLTIKKGWMNRSNIILGEWRS